MTIAPSKPRRTDDGGRARLPDASGVATSSDGVRHRVGGVRRRRPDDRAAAVDADRPLAPVEGARCRTSAAVARRDVRRPRQRPVRSADRSRRAYADDRIVDDISAVMDATGTDASGPRRAVHRRRLARDPARRRRTRSASSGSSRSPSGVPRLVAAAPVARPVLVRRRAAHRRRLGEDEPPLLAARLPRLRPFFFEARSRPSRTRRRRSRTPWAGRSTAPSTRCSRDARRRRLLLDGEGSRRSAGPSRCPMLHRPRHRGPLPADRSGPSPRRADRRAARRRRGRRPHDPGPPPGPRQPADPRLRPLARPGGRA